MPTINKSFKNIKEEISDSGYGHIGNELLENFSFLELLSIYRRAKKLNKVVNSIEKTLRKKRKEMEQI